MDRASSSNTCGHPEEVCWICLEEGTAHNQLGYPCACPRPVHRSCMARWQLQSAGKREEKQCRFCSKQLPDWRHTLTLNMDKAVPPVMTVFHKGDMYVVPVRPGPEGLIEFQDSIRRIFGYHSGVEINLSFGCTVPGSGEVVTLEGCGAFDAAVHCASVSAGLLANRQKRLRESGFQADHGDTSSSSSPSTSSSSSIGDAYREPVPESSAESEPISRPCTPEATEVVSTGFVGTDSPALWGPAPCLSARPCKRTRR